MEKEDRSKPPAENGLGFARCLWNMCTFSTDVKCIDCEDYMRAACKKGNEKEAAIFRDFQRGLANALSGMLSPEAYLEEKP